MPMFINLAVQILGNYIGIKVVNIIVRKFIFIVDSIKQSVFSKSTNMVTSIVNGTAFDASKLLFPI